MTTTPVITTPPNFVRLNESVSLREPPSSSSPASSSLRPTSIAQGSASGNDNDNDDSNRPLLILCMWMGASPKLVSKYTKHYIELFPSNTILLITCTMPEMFFVSTDRHSKLLRPALDVLLKYRDQEQGMVAGVYSNGGSYCLTQLARLYRESTGGEPLPLQATLFDSCPGSADIQAAIHAMYTTFPPSVTKSPIWATPAWLIAWFTLKVYQLMFAVTGAVDPITSIRKSLLDTTLFDLNNPQRSSFSSSSSSSSSSPPASSSRTFIYSHEDKSVPYLAVEAFVEESKAIGWTVAKHRFEGSHHVAHANLDKERYWGIVAQALRR
ncbi:hypothetical protein I316_07260 [Kwoniella heveanensis BCC8398]|uniref:Indole-diterpene biosynthesis protein PaxU n=1 Tax=Kwoniella heveanensis BCC8398 TaxID=1296120 RepID=A0A1B9GJE7_9TREE|nr:hypothetical protein I316_07260 [Kwoniella heveanensis BCC8398]